MSPLDAISAALLALRTNLMRSVLTTLGIIIGIGAVITMVAVGNGAEQEIGRTIQSLGSNLLIVSPAPPPSLSTGQERAAFQSLTEGDAEAIQNELTEVQAAAPFVQGNGAIVYGNLNWRTGIVGVTPEYFIARNWSTVLGRTITADEARGNVKVVVLGSAVADALFPGIDPVGLQVRIQRVPFTVIGVLEAKGQGFVSQDDVVLIPISTARVRILGRRSLRGDRVSQIAVSIWDESLIDDAITGIELILRDRHRQRDTEENDFRIDNLADVMEAGQTLIGIMQMLLTSIASISLVVGGIGIMNIMLVTVTERTREIGLRMAIGAKSIDILSQFVTEAVTLTLIGGAFGIVVGFVLSRVVSIFTGFESVVDAQAVAIAFTVSASIGIFFGFYPARKASRLDPIDALRYE